MIARDTHARRASTFSLAALVALACGCAPVGPEDPAGQSEDAIIGGVASGPEDNAVAVFGAPDGQGFCSGTLIAPNLVLTAKHCVRARAAAPRYACTGPSVDVAELRPAAAITVMFGNDLSGPMESHAVARIVDDGRPELCDRDVAVLVLQTPVSSVAPRTVRNSTLARGETLTAVGWGMTQYGYPDMRRKRSGVTVVPSTTSGASAIGANEILTTVAICRGDSGGPLFDRNGRVVSVVSRVRGGCASGNGIHLLARASVVLSVIDRARTGR